MGWESERVMNELTLVSCCDGRKEIVKLESFNGDLPIFDSMSV